MKIRYQNTQLWNECALVSIWNACRFWGLDYPVMGTKEYRLSCVEACAINGGATRVARQFRKCGIVRVYGKYVFGWVKWNLPVEFSVFCHRGYHSVLAVDVRDDRILLTNYAYDMTYWLSWDKLFDMSDDKCRPVQFRKGIE